MKGKFAEQKSYGFKNFEKLEVQIFFSKSQQVGRFLIFQSKLHVLSWFFLFLRKNRQFFEISLKVPSLARSVPKPLMGEAGEHL